MITTALTLALYSLAVVRAANVANTNTTTSTNPASTSGTSSGGNLTAAIEAVARLAQQAVTSNAVPGIAVAIVADGKVQYTAGFGVRKALGNQSVTPETVFPLASVSKPLSSTIISAVLTQHPELSWDDPINGRAVIAELSDPWVSSQATIADAFSHRTGLFPLAGDDLELYGFNRSTILSRLQALPQFAPFRDSFGYSNYGLTLGAEAVAESLGKEWADVAQDYLYGPLGMTSTSSKYSDFISRTNRANLHVPGSNGTGPWMSAPSRNPDAQAPAGGATSNVIDLAKWVQLHLNIGKIAQSNMQLISQAPLNETREPQIVRGPNPITNVTAFYGLGWNVDYRDGRVYNDHAGAFTQGIRSEVKMSVEDGLGIVVLANCFPTGVPEGIADTFFDIAHFGYSKMNYTARWDQLYADLANAEGGLGPFSGNPPANATSASPLQAYTGRFVNSYVGVVEFSPGQGQGNQNLIMRFPGSSNNTVPVLHWDRDTFYQADLKTDPAAGVAFTIGADGNATSVVIDAFNGYPGAGNGVLVRQM